MKRIDDDKALEFRCFMLMLCVSAFLIYMNVFTEYCSMTLEEENGLRGLSMITGFLIIGVMVLYVVGKQVKDEDAGKLIAVFVIVAPLFFSHNNRSEAMEKRFWEFDGVVSSKYISSNHAQKAIVVDGKEFEGVPGWLWQKIDIGTKIKKQACSGFSVNGVSYSYDGQAD